MKNHDHIAAVQAFFQDHRYISGPATARRAETLPWLAMYTGDTTAEKVWNVLHTRVGCVVCGGSTRWVNIQNGYRRTCSRACGQKSICTLKSIRQEALWANEAWRAGASAGMKSAHLHNRADKKLAQIAVRGITPTTALLPGMSTVYSWRHTCGEVFERPFTRVTGIWCPVCHVSRGQGELYEAIKALYSGPIIVNDRKVIKPKEIDIYLPDLKLGFEYQGEHWHPGDGSREALKIALAADAGVHLEEFWELLWRHKRAEQLDRLKKLLVK